MPIKLFSSFIEGVSAKKVEVEIETPSGLFLFQIVGLPDEVAKESKERVILALKNSGIKPPQNLGKKLIVNLAPATLKKKGSFFDLAVAVGYAFSTKQMGKVSFEDKIFVGELSFDGSLREVPGILAIALLAKKENKILVFPESQKNEVDIVDDLKIIYAKNLSELLKKLEREEVDLTSGKIPQADLKYEIDFSQIQGQKRAKRALEIAAAGEHHLLMLGSPGCGKTLLAKALVSILPQMTKDEIIEVSKIYGVLKGSFSLIFERPFRSPHHTSSVSAIIGGGNPIRPGEVTLAHRGVLFLDEFPEFRRDVLEALREPLEESWVRICRKEGSFLFPADFFLVAASNPCPCGYFLDEEKECTCSFSQIEKYKRKLSGPIMDRIDIKIKVSRQETNLFSKEKEEPSSKIRERVEKAREIQQKRYKNEPFSSNGKMPLSALKKYIQLSLEEERFLKESIKALALSPRSFHKVLKVARTIADLEGEEKIKREFLLEALSYQELLLER